MSRYKLGALAEARDVFEEMWEWPAWEFGYGSVAAFTVVVGYVACVAAVYWKTAGLITLRDGLTDALFLLPFAVVGIPAAWLALSLVCAFFVFVICAAMNVSEAWRDARSSKKS